MIKGLLFVWVPNYSKDFQTTIPVISFELLLEKLELSRFMNTRIASLPSLEKGKNRN